MKLNRRQKQFIARLLDPGFDVANVLKDLRVDVSVLRAWMRSPEFTTEVDDTISAVRLMSRVQVARSTPDVAATLINLTRDGKGETARKACLDILAERYHVAPSLLVPGGPHMEPGQSDLSSRPDMSDDVRAKLLAALAGEEP